MKEGETDTAAEGVDTGLTQSDQLEGTSACAATNEHDASVAAAFASQEESRKQQRHSQVLQDAAMAKRLHQEQVVALKQQQSNWLARRGWPGKPTRRHKRFVKQSSARRRRLNRHSGLLKQRIKQSSSRIGERSSTQTVHREDSKGSSTGRNLKKRRTSECLQSAAEDVQQRRVVTCKQ